MGTDSCKWTEEVANIGKGTNKDIAFEIGFVRRFNYNFIKNKKKIVKI